MDSFDQPTGGDCGAAQVEGPDEGTEPNEPNETANEDPKKVYSHYIVKVIKQFKGKTEAKKWLKHNEYPEGALVIRGFECSTKVERTLD